MPKSKGKGGKGRRRGKGGEGEKRELVFKEAEQEYAQVLKMLGNGRCDCMCVDGVKRLCHIRGKMRKRVWITTGDIVLVSLRDFQDEKADIILKYSADEARALKTYGELPDNLKINETDVMKGEFSDDGVEFADFVDSNSDDEPVARPGKPAAAPKVTTAAPVLPEKADGGIDLDAI
jgi:translation initiation factor 1A